MLNKAFSGFGTDEELVSYAIGSSSKEHIEAIADLYEDIYGKSLVEDATSELGGLFEGDFQKAVSQYLNRDPLCQPPPSPGSALCDSSQLGRLREEVTEALEYIAMDTAQRIRKASKGFGEFFALVHMSVANFPTKVSWTHTTGTNDSKIAMLSRFACCPSR